MSGKKNIYSRPEVTIYFTSPNLPLAISFTDDDQETMDTGAGSLGEGEGGAAKQQLFPWDEE